MTLEAQHHKAACDRNLKQAYHGVLVKDFTIIYDEYRLRYKAVVTMQLPFYDISAIDLKDWCLKTFPVIKEYLVNTDTFSLFNMQLRNISAKVIFFGHDKYTPKNPLYDVKISITDPAWEFESWSIEVIQNFLDESSFNGYRHENLRTEKA